MLDIHTPFSWWFSIGAVTCIRECALTASLFCCFSPQVLWLA